MVEEHFVRVFFFLSLLVIIKINVEQCLSQKNSRKIKGFYLSLSVLLDLINSA